YTPHDIGALDAREGERGLTADGEGSLVAFVLGRVQTLTGLAVGVVLGRGRDANEYLVRAGVGNGDVIVIDQLVDIAMAHQEHGSHMLGYRVRHGGLPLKVWYGNFIVRTKMLPDGGIT